MQKHGGFIIFLLTYVNGTLWWPLIFSPPYVERYLGLILVNELWTSLSFCCATSWFGRQSSGLKEWHVMRNQGPSGKINDQIKRDVNGLRPQSCEPLLQPCCGNTKAGTLPPSPQTHTWSKVHVLGLRCYDPFICKQESHTNQCRFPN